MLSVLGGGVLAFAAEAAASPALDAKGEPCIEDRSVFMKMDYWTFDQAPEGVRSVAERPGCNITAADLVRDYHEQLRQRGEPVTYEFDGQTVTFSENGAVTTLYWHEGQLRALAGQNGPAIGLFRKSLKSEQANYGGWNQYALATIAFLERNRETLEAYRADLAARVSADNINLGVVDGLIACFDKSYRDAYGSKDCDRRPRRSRSGN